jgi:CDP-diacylglycerol--serine O-phosphatidyltransferase
LYGLILVVGWLMVSTLPLMALKFKESGLRNNWPKLALVVLAVVAAVFLKWLAVPVVFVFYIIVSLVARGAGEKKNTTI